MKAIKKKEEDKKPTGRCPVNKSGDSLKGDVKVVIIVKVVERGKCRQRKSVAEYTKQNGRN